MVYSSPKLTVHSYYTANAVPIYIDASAEIHRNFCAVGAVLQRNLRRSVNGPLRLYLVHSALLSCNTYFCNKLQEREILVYSTRSKEVERLYFCNRRCSHFGDHSLCSVTRYHCQGGGKYDILITISNRYVERIECVAKVKFARGNLAYLMEGTCCCTFSDSFASTCVFTTLYRSAFLEIWCGSWIIDYLKTNKQKTG